MKKGERGSRMAMLYVLTFQRTAQRAIYKRNLKSRVTPGRGSLVQFKAGRSWGASVKTLATSFLSGRYDDLYGRTGDLVRLQESWHRCDGEVTPPGTG